MKEKMKVYIRWMIRRDLDFVCAIEQQYPSADSWVEGDFIRHLRVRNCIGFIAEDEHDEVVGFMVCMLDRERVSVLKFGVATGSAGKGVGRQMIDKLKSKLATGRRGEIVFTVDERSMGFLLVLRAMQFKATGVSRDCFSGVDGITMRYALCDFVNSSQLVLGDGVRDERS